MKKITIHHLSSVSEYCLDQDKTITEKKHLSNNEIKFYKYQKDNFGYSSILKLFKLNNKSKYETS
jgi:hypothetical protein|tara:strand:- start:1938 stop:2132 length:195 start_codon:yes stop_codon:yes gene_type:complete